MEPDLKPHEMSDKPTEFWRTWKKTANVMRLQVRAPTTPPADDKVASELAQVETLLLIHYI